MCCTRSAAKMHQVPILFWSVFCASLNFFPRKSFSRGNVLELILIQNILKSPADFEVKVSAVI